MNPKPTIDIDAAGIEAHRLFAEDRTADAELKDLRSQKIARKEQLKKALTVVWEALEKKQTVSDTDTKPQRQAAVTRKRLRLLVEGIRAHAAEEGISLEGFEKVTTLKQFRELAHHLEWTFNDRARRQWDAFHDKVEAGLEPFYKEHPEARPL